MSGLTLTEKVQFPSKAGFPGYFNYVLNSFKHKQGIEMQKQKIKTPPSPFSPWGGLFLQRFICIQFNKAHCFALFLHAKYEQINIFKFWVKILNYVNFCKTIRKSSFEMVYSFIQTFVLNLRLQDISWTKIYLKFSIQPSSIHPGFLFSIHPFWKQNFIFSLYLWIEPFTPG